MAEKEKIVYIVTHGPEDPERATFPFMLATAAQAMEVEAVVALQGTSVFLAKKGFLDHVSASGLPPLKDLVNRLSVKAVRSWSVSRASAIARSKSRI